MRSVDDKQLESTCSAASNSADLIRLKTAVYMLYVADVCFQRNGFTFLYDL